MHEIVLHKIEIWIEEKTALLYPSKDPNNFRFAALEQESIEIEKVNVSLYPLESPNRDFLWFLSCTNIPSLDVSYRGSTCNNVAKFAKLS